jgi:hypothetical protein
LSLVGCGRYTSALRTGGIDGNQSCKVELKKSVTSTQNFHGVPNEIHRLVSEDTFYFGFRGHILFLEFCFRDILFLELLIGSEIPFSGSTKKNRRK